MNFTKLFHKSNSSIYQLQGSVLDCTIEQIRGNKVIVDTGMRSSFVCFRDEVDIRPYARYARYARSGPVVVRDVDLSAESGILDSKNQNEQNRITKPVELRQSAPAPKSRLRRTSLPYGSGLRPSFVGPLVLRQSCVIGIEEKRSPFSGEFICHPPKFMEKLSTRKLVWTELTKLYRTQSKNRIKGFILNSVNGGYAVALAGYIAFLPKSLCLNKKVFIGQWRQFAIISMNPKIANIVVREIKTYARYRSLAYGSKVAPTTGKNRSQIQRRGATRSRRSRQNPSQRRDDGATMARRSEAASS